jgi:copper chaperone CopZ
MSCGACVSAIERLLLSQPGVEQASVALLTERANVIGCLPLSIALLDDPKVVYDSTRVTWQVLLAAIENAGYRAKHLRTRRFDPIPPSLRLSLTLCSSLSHKSDNRNDNSDCRQRIFRVEASRASTGPIQSTFNGLQTLLGTAGVLETKW